MHSRFRPILAASSLLLACSFIAAPLPSTTTYQFTGTCGACTGNAIGTLTVLSTYTPGGPFLSPFFVSFSFSSNLGNFTITEPATVGGRLQAAMPSPASVSFANGTNFFQSDLATGQWCIGTVGCALDSTSNGVWGPPSSPTTAVGAPALSDWMLFILAAALAVMGSILLKKIQARKAA